MGVYVDKIVGYIADVTKEFEEIGDEVFSDNFEHALSKELADLGYKAYYSKERPGENDIILIYDGMMGAYAKLIFIKSIEYYSSDETEPSPFINEALKMIEVPTEIREKMQGVYSNIFKRDNPIDVHLQQFSYWR